MSKDEKLKVVEIKKAGGDVYVVTISYQGENYQFAIDSWELIDENKFTSYLKLWKDEVIPKKKLAKSMSESDLQKLIEKYKKLEV